MNNKNADILIKAKAILTLDEKNNIFSPGYLTIKDKKILKIGEYDRSKEIEAEKSYSFDRHVIIPGLINTHTHAPMSLFRGIADDLPLKKWLENHIWPLEKKYVNAEFVKAGSMIACAEMVKSGITTFADMYFCEEEVAEAARKVGIRVMIGEGILDFPTPVSENVDESFERAERLIKRYLNDKFVATSVCPHSPYTCSKDTLIRALKLAEKYDIPIHIHLAEEKWEVEKFQQEQGKTPVEFLKDLGFFEGPKVIAAHVNWVNENDIEILSNTKVGVSHNPKSNMKLATGICPVPEMVEKNTLVALGTDGASSNNSLSILEEAQQAARLHKIASKDPTVIPADIALKMATINGAKVIGKEKSIGSLETGKLADVVALNFNKIHLSPVYDYFSHLIYAAKSGDVEHVFISGKPVVLNGQLINIDNEEIIDKAKHYGAKISGDST